MDNFVTVDNLKKLINELSQNGFGDMKIKCQDGYLHKDEISVDYFDRELRLRGMLYNSPITQKMNNFCKGVKKLQEEFLITNYNKASESGRKEI